MRLVKEAKRGGQRRERCESEEVQCHVAGGIRFRMAAQQPGQRGEFPKCRASGVQGDYAHNGVEGAKHWR